MDGDEVKSENDDDGNLVIFDGIMIISMLFMLLVPLISRALQKMMWWVEL